MSKFPIGAAVWRRSALSHAAALSLCVGSTATWADAPPESARRPVHDGGVVTVTGARPTSLPTQIPTTIEGITAEELALTVNATDSEDALKYFPSLLVRKRYIGDYNHAVLSSRASGTGNSARSMVFADGILLSNYLGNGANFTPRWGVVAPEEIDRVDVLYGPFSAAYAGNSVGAVVDYVTRMPSGFEAHGRLQGFVQPFKLYNTRDTYSGGQASMTLGDRQGAFAWWLHLGHLDSESQPLVFATRTAANGTAGTSGTAVTGAVSGQDKTNAPWFIIGTSTQYHTVQDQAKLKLSYDISPTLRAQLLLAGWHNRAEGQSESYLKDANGNPVYSGGLNVGGLSYTAASGAKAGVLASDFPLNKDRLAHSMQALSVKSHTKGVFDGELALSRYAYDQDDQRRSTTALPASQSGGAGTLTQLEGSGWTTLAARGTWRPNGLKGAHIVDAGVQQDHYRLRTNVFSLGNWLTDDTGAVASRFNGETQLQAVWAQDTWGWAPGWKTVLGLRGEHWTAQNGLTQTGTNTYLHPERAATMWSPKLALSYQATETLVLKASSGRAVRFPTVSELYQGAATATGISNIANPNLRPERSQTTELSGLWTVADNADVRLTAFHEETTDALYSQALPNITPLTNAVQNVDGVRTTGLELALKGNDLLSTWIKGLDAQASLTYADSKIVANSGYVSKPGDTLGRWQPRVPRWRGTALVTWRATPDLSVAYGARYSGVQYSSLDNSDVNGFAYTGASKYVTTDLRLHYRVNKQWSAAFGIDNLNNYQYWNFHPYPQRTYSAELKFDL